jgi:hypothetical protein
MLRFFSLGERLQSYCIQYSLLRYLFCPTISLVYTDQAFSTVSFSNDTVLVLSPNDYWALRVELNVNSEKEAATYGPALFELANGYRYEAQFLGNNQYILIAYNPEKLSQKLLTHQNFLGIKKITFAQWVFADMEQPIWLESGKYLTSIDRIVIELDGSYLKTDGSITLKEALGYPKPFLKKIRIDGLVKSILTTKTFKTTLIILLILFGNLVTQGVMTYKESNRLQKNIEDILNKSNLHETSIERIAFLESLRKKEAQQLHFRDQCKILSNLHVDVKKIPLPFAPPMPTLPIDGIVLIPGSNPGEPNRLLVEEKTSSATMRPNVEGIETLVYDGHSIHLIINTHEHNESKKVKDELLKRFKKAQIEEHDNQLEGWIK